MTVDVATENQTNVSWQSLLPAAKALFEARAFSEAEAAYQEIIEAVPKHLVANLGASRCARERGDRSASLAYLNAAALEHPAHVGLQMERATDLQALLCIDEAEATYKSVIEIVPDHTPAYRALGHCARRRGDRRASMHILRSAIKAVPADPWLRIELATDLRELGELDAAEEACRQALALAPCNAQAHIGLGQCARRRGDRRASLHMLRSAITAVPADPWLRIELATDLRELGELDAAEEACRQALALAPRNAQAHIGLGQCARRRGDRRASTHILRSAITAVPADPWLRIELATDLRELGELDAAEEACRQALALAPSNAQAHIGLGQCARRRGDRRASARILRSAMTAVPADPWLRIELAADLRELGLLDEAEANYFEVLSMSSTNVHAHLGLGICARIRGDRASALAHFRTANRLNPNNAAPLLEIALEQREAGDAEDALQTAREVLVCHPTNGQAAMSIGFTERYRGSHSSALDAFRVAHSINPGQAGPLVAMAQQARLLNRQEDYDRYLAQAASVEPGNVSVIVLLAETAILAADFDTALKIYKRAIDQDTGRLEFHLGVAEALASIGKVDEALAELASLQEARGAISAIYSKRLSLLRRSGHFIAARRLAIEATTVAPHAFQNWVQRFYSELQLASKTDLEKYLGQVRASDVHQRATLACLNGLFQESQWQYQQALDFYAEAADLNPNDSAVHQHLARVKTLTFDLEGARRHLRKFSQMTSYKIKLQQKSCNISQSLYGQILEEFSLDRKLAEALRRLQDVQPSTRIGELYRYILEYPDSTAVAIGLMVALRQAGTFSWTPGIPLGGLKCIPQSVIQFWDSEDPPQDVTGLMRSWQELNPEFFYKLLNEKTATQYLARRHPPQVLKAFQTVSEPARKSDIFRLAWLALEGGVYVDADDRCLAPLNAILPNDAELVLYQEDVCSIGNNFIAARPGHPVIQEALQLAVQAIHRGDVDNVWLSSGPGLLTRVLAEHLATLAKNQVRMPAGILILNLQRIFHHIAMHCTLGYKHSVRHWVVGAFTKRRSAT